MSRAGLRDARCSVFARLSIKRKFAVYTIALTIVAIVFSVLAVLAVNERYVVYLLGNEAAHHAESHVRKYVFSGDFLRKDSPVAENDYERLYDNLKSDAIKGIRIWNAQSRPLFYRDPNYGPDQFLNLKLLAEAQMGNIGFDIVYPTAPPVANTDLRERILVIYVPVHLSDATRTDGVVEIHYSLFESDSVMFALSCTFAIFGTIGGLALLIGYLVIFEMLVARRLILLKEAAKHIAQGDLRKRTPVGPADEIGTLATSFNVMADKIQEHYRTLDKKVKTQTDYLTQKIDELENHKAATLNILVDLDDANIELNETRARITATLECVGDALVVYDKEGRITYVNRQALALFRWKSAQDAVGKKYFEVLNIEDAAEKSVPIPERPITVCLATRKKFEAIAPIRYCYLRNDGTRFPASIIVSPIMSDGTFIGAISSIRDATTEEEISRSKTEFVSIASHQLRTPLSTIKWYAEMLLDEEIGKLNVNQERYLQQVFDSNKRMIDLVNALLNVSRIDMGELAISPELFSIGKLIESVSADLRLVAKKKHLHLVKELEKIPDISADPTLVRIIIQNLLANAFTYTPKGGTVTVRLKSEKKSALVSVTDTGCGIPKKNQASIFKKFFRADNARVIEPAGNGLGLYLTKAVVERMGGEIWFESEENVGTTFSVRLPLVVEKREGAKTLVMNP